MEDQSLNDAQCPPETVASFFRMIDFYEKEIETHQEKIQQLMAMLQQEAGKTFMHEGQLYQVCQRKKEGTYFFKLLDKPPKSWLGREAREARERCRSNSEARALEQSDPTDAVHEESGASVRSGESSDASPEGATVAADTDE